MSDLTLAARTTEEQGGARLLRAASIGFAVAVLLHNTDHLRRGGDSVSAEVFWLGTAAILIEVGVVALVAAGHRIAPLASVVAGFTLALGYIGTHFTPERGWASDSLLRDASPVSVVAAVIETTAAVGLGLAGLVALHRRGGLASAVQPGPSPLPLRQVVRDPVVVAMAVGNLIILFGSIATR